MSDFTFSLSEILQMARRIEENGEAFYRKAAETVEEDSLKNLFTELADMEVEHARVFDAMKEQLEGKDAALTAFDPQGEAALYLGAFVDRRIFDPDEDPLAIFSGEVDAEKILLKAIEKEKETIIFYLGLKDAVYASSMQDAVRPSIDDIIGEEKKHVAVLADKLKTLAS